MLGQVFQFCSGLASEAMLRQVVWLYQVYSGSDLIYQVRLRLVRLDLVSSG
jgi:hypothetical protein